MESVDFGKNSKIYLQNQASKFWEIRNDNQTNHIRKGEIINGKEENIESAETRFNSFEKAINKAKEAIISKRSKGFAIKKAKEINNDELQGDYLEKGQEFFKVQICDERVKTEKGGKSGTPETSIYTYKDHQTALTKAIELIRKMIANGFKRNSVKFVFDFNKSDLLKTVSIISESEQSDKKEGYLNALDKQCTLEISEDEEDGQSLETDKLNSILRRSGAIEIDKNEFPVSKALLLSSMHVHQVVEDEENGVLTSFIFEKPEIKDDLLKISQNTEVLEETEEEVEVDLNVTQILPELPAKRKRKESRYPTIQSMLSSITLDRYVLNFETRGISPEQFLLMNDKELQELGIPTKIRGKILACIQDGE